MDLSFKLEAFEGPLDLLLQLIDKNKVNIYDIPIAMITDQYMQVLEELKQYPIDNMSEFLVMAATLLRIKSQMLLPVEVEETEENTDPRAELVERLLEYKMYKYASYELKDRQIDAAKHLYRKEQLPKEVVNFKEEVSAEQVIEEGNVTLLKLNTIFNEVMKRQDNRIDPIRSKFGKIEKEEINFKEKILDIQRFGLSHRKFSFRKLLEKAMDKVELIVTFLGILELIHMGRVCIHQKKLFDDFEVEYLATDVVPIEAFV
ncbi:MAG: segregation/condensation protein A [Lachnospiraceae bacterium]|nr:segregation/condensation protein A [Lachnospiraceae bacterium]